MLKETNSFRRPDNVKTIMTNKYNIKHTVNFFIKYLPEDGREGQKHIRSLPHVYIYSIYIYIYTRAYKTCFYIYVYIYIYIYIYIYVYIKHVVNFIRVSALFAHLQGGIYICIYIYIHKYSSLNDGDTFREMFR